MNNKIQIILTVIGVLIAFFAWQYPKQNEQVYKNEMLSKDIKPLRNANLKLSGTNLKINIKKGKYFYSSSSVDSINLKKTIFINKSQMLTINVTGINIDLYIDKEIRENIVINNEGTNLKVREI